MTSIRKLASALCLATFCSFSNAQQVTTQTHQIGDDGWANAPLQFDFPLYGQSFNNSWMYSNGAVGFVNPLEGGLGGNNLSVQQFSSSMGNQYNYTIYGLWTDLINLQGTFQTESSTEFQRYSWIGISPFYDSNRLNTFSIEIRPDGKIITNYSLIDANYATVGIVGNASANEFEQIHHSWSGVNTSTIPNWERTTSAPPADPCLQDPMYSSSCPGYLTALQSLIPQTTATPVIETQTVVVDPVQETINTLSSPTTVSSSSIATSNETQVASSPSTTSPATQTTVERSSRTGASTSQILSILANERSRLSSVETSVMDSSISQATREAESATSQAESIASSSSTTSIETSIAIANQQATAATQSSNESLGTGIVVAIAQPLLNANSVSSFSSQSEMMFDFANNTETTTESSSSLTSATSIENLTKENPIPTEQAQEQSQQSTVNRNAPNNEAAGSVTLASYTAAPPGFDLYFNSLTDSPFYAPKEIYKNQKNVDNARILRQLSGASDRVHAEMVEQQYAR